MEQHSPILTRALVRLLTPLVRILLRYGVSYGAFAEIGKRVYVTVAERELAVTGGKRTTSRVAVVTGLNRKEVARVRRLPPEAFDAVDERYNRAARVVAGWLRDPDFHDASGAPAMLDTDDAEGFPALVRRYSGDMTVRAVLDELVQSGAVVRDDDGRVRLMQRGYVPAADDVAKLQILGTDTRDLIATIDHNLEHGDGERLFQRKVAYDNVPAEHVESFRALAAGRGQALLEELDRWLAARDRDAGGQVTGRGRVRLGLAIHQIEETGDAGDGDDGGREDDR